MEVKITKNIKEANLVTHTGTFHPDDVFSTMFLSLWVENPIVARVSDCSNANTDAIIYDIGFGSFDHHGPTAKMRTDAIKYCSFGLLWESFGKKFLEQMNYKYVDLLYKVIEEKLVLQIDAIDNGYFYKIDVPYKILDLDKIIDSFNKAWNEEIDNDFCFLEAVSYAEILFKRILVKENARIEAMYAVYDAIPSVENSILFLDTYMPYQDAIFTSNNEKAANIKVIIFPSNRGGYTIKPRTVSKDSKELICNFPKKFWGLHDEELAQVSGIAGSTFVHSNGFIASAKTYEDAYLLAQMAIENVEEI